MARKKQQRIFTILGGLAGTVVTVLGIRQGIQWYQRRQAQIASESADLRSKNAWSDARRSQPIPATGQMAPPDLIVMQEMEERVPPQELEIPQEMELEPPAFASTTDVSEPKMPEPTNSAERANSDRVSDFDDRGTAFTTSEPAEAQARDMRGAESAMGDQSGQMPAADQPAAGQKSRIVMDEFVAPLIEHAIAFNSVMNLLRSRQRDGVGHEGVESLTEGDRNSMRAVLRQMQEHVVNYDEADMRGNPLAKRSFDLTQKLRDALDNVTYSGADLYRLQEEIKKELCKLANDLDKSHQVTITGLDQVRQLYECQQ